MWARVSLPDVLLAVPLPTARDAAPRREMPASVPSMSSSGTLTAAEPVLPVCVKVSVLVPFKVLLITSWTVHASTADAAPFQYVPDNFKIGDEVVLLLLNNSIAHPCQSGNPVLLVADSE